jgi:hypothetical protein
MSLFIKRSDTKSRECNDNKEVDCRIYLEDRSLKILSWS